MLAACGGSARRAERGRGGAPTLSQVTAVLARHAAAVRQHSSADFLADVDTADAAAGFRQRQRAQLADLAAVPLRRWNYAVSAPVTDRSALAASTKRLGAPARIVHLTVSYALSGVDPQPSSHDLWWTFVRRHGHVVIAADDDMAQLGGVSWTGPWDFGPIVAVRGSAGLVLGHPSDATRLPRVAAAVDAAVPAVTAVWGTGWARQVAVFVPASGPELTALAGTGTTLTDISALAVFDAADADARLILNSGALAALTPIGLGIVLRHEITHIASAADTGASLPRWLVEGFADYVANLTSGQPVRDAARELRADLAPGRAAGGAARRRGVRARRGEAGADLRAGLARVPAHRGPGRRGRTGAPLPSGRRLDRRAGGGRGRGRAGGAARVGGRVHRDNGATT